MSGNWGITSCGKSGEFTRRGTSLLQEQELQEQETSSESACAHDAIDGFALQMLLILRSLN